MNVLHVVASLSRKWGGPVFVVKGLTEQLARKGIEVSIFALNRGRSSGEIVKPKGTEIRLFRQNFLSRGWTVPSSKLARVLYPRSL